MSDKPHKRLDVWKLSMELCRDVYAVCRELPAEERFGLTAQMKRAVVSVPSNIAEGAGRNSPKEFVQFLGVAQGSQAELDTQLELCCDDLDLTERDELVHVLEKVERISMMLVALKKAVSRKP